MEKQQPLIGEVYSSSSRTVRARNDESSRKHISHGKYTGKNRQIGTPTANNCIVFTLCIVFYTTTSVHPVSVRNLYLAHVTQPRDETVRRVDDLSLPLYTRLTHLR